MSHRIKRMKPIVGKNSRKSKRERVAERIPNEERLLEWLSNELPEHRLRLFEAVEPYLKFALSSGFDRKKLRDMVYVPAEGDISPELAGKA